MKTGILPLRMCFLVLLLSLLSACGLRDGAASPPVYVAIGASDAVGVGARNPESEGWVARVHASLPRGARLVNLGVSGSELSEAIAQQLPVALDAQPDIVTVWLAVNDLKNGVPLSAYERDLDTLLGRLQSTGARVLVGNMPDLTQLRVPDQVLRAYGIPDNATLRREIGRWNAAIARVAGEHGAEVVDIHARWRELEAHPEYLSADGFHPSTEGYARLADLWTERLAVARAR